MKLELGEKRPQNFQESWPGQYEVFNHFEFNCGIPSVLFAITTIKENAKPNVSFAAWSGFSGDSKGFYAVLQGVTKGCHTYKNIMRTGEFTVNFINKNYFDNCMATIRDNGEDTDEIAAGGFTEEKAHFISAPRLAEAFLCLECTLEKTVDIGEGGMLLLVGKVRHIAAQEEYAQGMDKKYGDDGFMFNIHSPKSFTSGLGEAGAVGICKIARINEEG